VAQAPSGPVNFAFASASTAVYDLSGTYNIDQDIQGAGDTPVPLSLQGLVITHDAAGRLRGSGLIVVTIGSDSAMAAFCAASGQVSGGGNTPTKVTLSVHLTGNDVVSGRTTPFNISLRYDFTVDPAAGALVGSARGSASFSLLSAGRINSDNVSVPLPPGVDGSWSAQLSITPLRKLAGAGAVVLSNGRTVPVNATGAFSANSGESSMRLSGALSGFNDGRGTLLKMTFLTDAVQPDTLSGKILGQKVIQ
jgi:hypothetical protein